MFGVSLRLLAVALVTTALFVICSCGSNPGHGCLVAAGDCCAGAPCVAPRYLYATGINGQVTTFPIVFGTGGLGTPTSIPGPANTFGMAALNNSFLYVSNPSLGGVGSIDAWTIDLSTGGLTTVPGSPFNLGMLSLPNGLAANPNTQLLYAADAGKIDALKADATGALSPIAGSPFPAGSNLFLTIDPLYRFVFASDHTPPGNVLAFTIDSIGALTPAPGSPFPTIPNYVGDTSPSEIVVDSTGNFVYVGLLSTNQVAAFSIVSSTGALNPVPGSPFPSGNGPLILATGSKFLYVSNGFDGTVSGYSIDPVTGILDPLAGSPFPIRAVAILVDPDGRFLYASTSGGMMAFSIDPSTGALTQVGSSVTFAGATALAYVR